MSADGLGNKAARPGAEDWLDQALLAFQNALERGEAVDRAAFLQAYPGHQAELAPALETLERIHLAGRELRPAGRVTPLELTRLGDYRLLRVIGMGGMGVVYEAEQVSLGRRVAVKVLPHHADAPPHLRQRFELEARAAALLQHPHVVPVYATGLEAGLHYYVMPYVEGPSLAAVFRTQRRLAGRGEDEGEGRPHRPFGEAAYFQQVARWGGQVANALACAHAAGIVHRDIKPGNLLLDAQQQVLITDFGLARMQNEAGLTQTGHVVGTFRYMSPEQLRGKSQLVDGRADLYSLGVTLYELLTLEHAFTGPSLSQARGYREEPEPPPARRRNPAVPRDLETVVRKAMEPDPKDRYATAAEMAADLQRFLDGQPVLARQPRWYHHAWKWSKRHRPALALITAALVVGGILSLVWSQQHIRAALAQAEADRDLARRAVDQMLDELLALNNLPGVQRQQVAAAEKALALYEELVHGPTDHTGRWRLARTRRILAGWYSKLGQAAREEQLLQQAVAELEPLVQQQPQKAYRLELAHAYSMLLGRHPEAALQMHRQMVALYESMCAEEPASDHLRGMLAEERISLGRELIARGTLVEGEAELRRALEVMDVYARDVQDAQAQIRLVSILRHLGEHYLDQGREQDGVALLQRIAQVDEVLARHHPDKPALRADLVPAGDVLTRWYLEQGHWAEGARRLAKQHAFLEDLIKAYPDLPWYQDLLGNQLVDELELFHLHGLTQETAQNLRQALRHFRGMEQKHPEVWRPRINRARLLATRPSVWGLSQAHAVGLLQECPAEDGQKPYPWWYWLYRATVYYHCGRYATAQGEAERALQRVSHPRSRALCHLHLALIFGRQGQAATAREHYAAAEGWYRGHPYAPAPLRLRRELAPLLGVPAPSLPFPWPF